MSASSKIPRALTYTLAVCAFGLGFILNSNLPRDYTSGDAVLYNALIWGLIFAFAVMAGIWLIERVRSYVNRD